MPNKRTARIGKTYVGIATQTTVNTIRMQAQDIASWVKAIDAARSETNPKRKLLYELYDQIKLDGHLESVMHKRIIAVTNKRLHFSEKGKEGEVNEFVRDYILETPWLHKLIGLIQEAKFYGHSLVEFIPGPNGVEDVHLIPRVNVIPERQFLKWHFANDLEGFNYKLDPQHSKFLLEAGGPKDYGLLMIAAQYVIYKRGGFGDWAQFAEIFGMPFRVGKYNAYDDNSRQKLEEGLKEAGGAAHMVIPEGTSIEFHNTSNTGQSDVFKDLVEMCNKEISKIVLGQTMTTEDGSSKSQSETHKEVEEDINLADQIELEYLLNWELSDKLRGLGIALPEGRFYFDQTQKLSLVERIKIDIELAKIIRIKPEYWYETYGVEVPDGGPEEIEKIVLDKLDQDPKPPKPGSKKKVLTNQLELPCCGIDHPYNSGHPYTSITAKISSKEEELLRKVFEGTQGVYDPSSLQANLNQLIGAVRSSISIDAAFGSPDHLMGVLMELNVHRFGFDKSLEQIIDLNKALDPNQTYSQFKKKADQILLEYNRHYLNTEYNLAISASQNGAAWLRQKAEQNRYPYLMYKTIGDSNVRNSHQALEGMIFKVSDTSWRSIYPPNGYNCRCEMIQLPASLVDLDQVSTGDKAVAALGDDWGKMVQTGFNKNRGETKDIFDLNKTYLEGATMRRGIDLNKLSYKDAGLQSINADLTKNRRLLPVSKSATRETILQDWGSRKKVIAGKELALVKDYSGRNLGIEYGSLGKNLKGKFLSPEEQRHAIYRNVKPTLSNPDEVYLIQSRSNHFQYKYLKFYQDATMVVITEVSKSGELLLKTWFKEVAEEKTRTGILIKGGV